MLNIIAILTIAFLPSSTSAWCSNTSRNVLNDFFVDDDIETWLGSGLGIILTAPHGGMLKPPTIPNRDAGCLDEQNGVCVWSHGCGTKNVNRCPTVNDIDMYTAELTRQVRMNLCCYFAGLCPVTIISLLAREKHDPNREIGEATFDVQRAQESFERYHGLITDMSHRISTQSGKGGLLIDIHGHSHPIERAEIGYLFSGQQLDSSRSVLNPAQSSIYSLANRSHSFESILRGNASFGRFLGAYGYDSVPSPNVSGPAGEVYFNGGYTVQRHGSRDGGTVDAIQVESPKSFRMPAMQKKYACALAFAAADFYCEHYANGSTRACLLPPRDKLNMFEQCIDPSSRQSSATRAEEIIGAILLCLIIRFV